MFWNIKGRNLSLPKTMRWLKHPVLVEDMKTLLAGWPIELPHVQERGRPWFEQIAPDELEPQNIYHAQRHRRFSAERTPPNMGADVTAAPPDSTRPTTDGAMADQPERPTRRSLILVSAAILAFMALAGWFVLARLGKVRQRG